MTVAPSIACIGAGYWGKNLVRNFQSLNALRWICETDPVRQRELRESSPGVQITDTVDRVLQDPDVAGVAIATPAETHGELVRGRSQRARTSSSRSRCVSPSRREGPRDARAATADEC